MGQHWAGSRSTPDQQGPGRWWARIVGFLLIVLGIVIGAGGGWLVALGGSWYYLIAGCGLVLAGVLVVADRPTGAWVYGAVWLGTIMWAIWEVTLDGWQPFTDGWALVPRVVAPTIVLLLVLSACPALRQRRRGEATAPLASSALGLFAIVLTAALTPATALSQASGGGPSVTGRSAIEGAGTAPDVPRNTLDPRVPVAAAEPLETGVDWPVYGGTIGGTRYSPLDLINRDNVGRLQQVWAVHTGDLPTEETEGKYSPEVTPIKIGDSLFLCTPMDILLSLDAGTGKEEWRYDPGVPADAIPYGATCRGVAFYADPAADPQALCARRIIEATMDARLIAVDANTGQPCTGFGQQGMVDLQRGIGDTVPGWYGVNSPPVIVRGIAVVGAQVNDNQAEDAPSGVIRGYDAVSGELAWAWDMGNTALTGEPAEGEVYTRGTPNMWTIAAGDQELGQVYLPLGNSAVDYFGGNRADFENEFSSSLVAIDVTTGEPVWHFQTVHYDVWDYDLGSQVTLVDVPSDRGNVPALILPSKQGQIYVLNRKTGEPLFPVEQRPVPSGGVEPEKLSKTQPYSTYARLDQPPLTERDMWGMSPIDQLWCRIQFRRATYEGEYTPPTEDGSYIQYPGYNGGSDWGSVAVDPVRGILVANYNDMPNYNRLVPRQEADARGIRPITAPGGAKGDAMAGSPYAIEVNAGWRVPFTGMLCKEPPYGWIRGIELATGRTLWDEPFGSAVNNGPFGIPSMLPLTIGTPNNGGPIVTAGGLTFVAATTDDKLRAFDTQTGEELWQTDLPAGGQTTPITYAVDGRQYVVIYPGGHHFMETEIGDQIIAYGLPAAE